MSKYIKVDDLQRYCDNQKDHTITPNEFQRMTQYDFGWHTGTPTEEGWYLLQYPKCKEQPYELAQWNGEHFVAVKPFHAIIVRIEASSVPYWQKIEEN